MKASREWYDENLSGIDKLKALTVGDAIGYGGAGLLDEAVRQAILELDERLRTLESADE